MISIEDFKDKKNKIDWKAYHQAQIDAGEKCTRCQSSILFGCGYQTECQSCKDLSSPDSVYHETYIRCPKCGQCEDVYESEYYDIMQQGDHDVDCSDCGESYTVNTTVVYTYESPEKL